MKLNYKLASLIFIALYSVGIIILYTPQFENLVQLLTPFFLTTICTLVILGSLNLTKTVALFLALVFTISFLAEMIGTNTGLLFGNYSYSEVLGIQLLNTPLVIGVNWILVTMGALNLASLITKSRFMIIILCAGFATVFDIILEPIAIKLNFWTWQQYLPGFYNYFCWFVLGLLFGWLGTKLKLTYITNLPAINFFVMLVYLIVAYLLK